jgi:ribokinase
MKKILTIGSTVVDIFIRSNKFEMPEEGKMCFGVAGGKMDVNSFEVHPGGGGGNTAVGFARRGFETKVISELGKDDLAELILKNLYKEGVGSEFVVSERLEQTGGSVILVSDSGERMVLVHRGAASMLDPKDIDFEKMAEKGFTPDWIHVSSLSGRKDTLAHIFHYVRQHDLKLSWNPGSADLKLLAEGKCDVDRVEAEVMFVNKEEWELVKEQQEALANQVPQIVVTDGSNGGRVIQRGGECVEYQAESVQALDNTGAGDAFCVGYVSALLEGKECVEAAEMGAKSSAGVVQQIGAKPGLIKK